MKIRLVGLSLIVIGILFCVLFIYLPIRDGGEGFMGPMRAKVLVFVPLSIVTGLAFAFGGEPVLAAFQAKPKSTSQMTLVLSIIIGSGVLTAIGFWQIKSRWLREPETIILAPPVMPPPSVTQPVITPPVITPPPPVQR